MSRTRKSRDAEEARRLGETTIAFYDRFARAFWDGTRDHDVSQNYAAFLDAIEGDPPYCILDLGCGPGRDLGVLPIVGARSHRTRWISAIHRDGACTFGLRGPASGFPGYAI